MKKHHFLPTIIIIFFLLLIFKTPAKAENQLGQRYYALLSGSNEIPSTSSQATGIVIIHMPSDPVVQDEFDMNVFVQGLVDTDLTGAHIHVGSTNENGPVIFNIGTNTASWVENFGGTVRTFHSQSFPQASIADLNSGNLYVNIHTNAFPGGEIRGQIIPGDLPQITRSNPISWQTNNISLTADDFYIEANGKRFYSKGPMIQTSFVRSTSETSSGSELVFITQWFEQGVYMDLVFHFDRDTNFNWAYRLNTRSGLPDSSNENIQYPDINQTNTGSQGYFYTQHGVAFTGAVDITTGPNNQYTGKIHFTNLRLQVVFDPTDFGDLQIVSFFEGVRQARPDRQVEVTVEWPGTLISDATRNATFASDNTGKYTSLALENLYRGVANVRINGPSHLTKQVSSVTISGNTLRTIDTTTADLKSGDLVDDNVVDILDYNAFLSNFGPRMSIDSNADMDFDGDVDIFDYRFIVGNYGQSGD